MKQNAFYNSISWENNGVNIFFVIFWRQDTKEMKKYTGEKRQVFARILTAGTVKRKFARRKNKPLSENRKGK